MSFTNPRNRDELKQYIKMRLGAPVLQINVSDEQMDIAITDAFAYYFGRNHYNGTERVYIGLRVEQPFVTHFKSKTLTPVTQTTTPTVEADGMVDTVTLISAGTGYPATTGSKPSLIDMPTTSTTGSGEKLSVNLGETRTSAGGLTSVTVNRTGSGYAVGDQFTVSGYNVSSGTPATFEVATIKSSSPVYGQAIFEHQNNFIILPSNVLSVSNIMKKTGYMGIGMGGMPGISMMNPFLMAGGGGCGNMGFDLVSFYTMQEYLALIDWMLFPPISYNYNQRLHRLYLNSDNLNGIGVNDYLMFECNVYPEPDMYPEMYSDFWLKEYVVGLVKFQWGTNLTKYQNVQMPGGITMNGEQIKSDAAQLLEKMRDRFAMDAADPPLDLIG